MGSRGVVAAGAALLLALTACEVEKVAIPRTESRVAAHAVLSASAPSQVVLLERTRNGSIQMIAPPFDLADPVVSDEGIAETGAIVTLRTPGGQVLFAREDNTTTDNGKGRGIYRFSLAGSELERNRSYRLSVITKGGELLGGETVVPGGVVAQEPQPRTFDRDRDSALISWPPSPGARSYYVRIETPFGPRSFFTDSTRVRLTGELRNVDIRSLPHVFIPGFPQAVTVSAVDSNFFDWFRTHDDALSGAGLLNRISGGYGFFGSLVRIHFLDLSVVAPQSGPSAGRFLFVGTPLEQSTTPYIRFDLYLESAAARSDQPDALSGQYEKRPGNMDPGCRICGVLGTVRNGRVTLALLRDWSATDTTDVLDGEIRGDTLIGSYRGRGGLVHLVRKR